MKEKCSYCKGSGKTFFSNLKNYTCPSCKGLGYFSDGWEKEFEDFLFANPNGYIYLKKEYLAGLVEYLGVVMEKEGCFPKKVKIKCKDGCIQIERIK